MLAIQSVCPTVQNLDVVKKQVFVDLVFVKSIVFIKKWEKVYALSVSLSHHLLQKSDLIKVDHFILPYDIWHSSINYYWNVR